MEEFTREFLYLSPKEIGVHPVLKYFEENGAFSYTDHELTRLVASFQVIGPLQPILITPADENEEGVNWWRVAGKLRIAAAKKVGCNIPCYIRKFASDEEVVRAARYENSIRRHWNMDRLNSEDELIDKLMSQRSRSRLKNTKQLHPGWHKLMKSGLIRHRQDDSLITQLKELDYEVQEALTDIYENIMSIKVSKGDKEPEEAGINQAAIEKVKKEFEEEIAGYNKKNKELLTAVKRLQEEIEEIQQSKSKSDELNHDQLAARYEKRIAALRTEKHEKEAEITRLKSELYNAHQKFTVESDLVRGERFKHIASDLSILADSTLTRLEQLTRAITITLRGEGIPATKDTILVLNDQIEKFAEKFSKQVSVLKSNIINQLNHQSEEPKYNISDN